MTEQKTDAEKMQWTSTHEEPPQMFAEAFVSDGTMTFGTTTTEWISSDTVMWVKR